MAKNKNKRKARKKTRPPGLVQFEKAVEAFLEKAVVEHNFVEVSIDQLAKNREEAIEILKHAFSLPNEGETAAVAIAREKTAALFYDRVWSPYAPIVPQDIHFCGATPAELEVVVAMVRRLKDQDFQDERSFSSFIGEKFKTWKQVTYQWKKRNIVEVKERTLQRLLAESHWQHHALRTVPIYASAVEQDSDFYEGDKRAIIAALSNLPLPIEDALSWEQVKELRKDEASKVDLRRLLHWFGIKMVGKSQAFVSDHLAITIDNYTKSLRKYGIRTALSAISGTFSAISIPTVLMHVAQQPLWLSLVEGIAIGSGALAKVAEKYIDTKPDPPPEIAWVFEIQKRLKE